MSSLHLPIKRINLGRIKLGANVIGASKLAIKQSVQYSNERKQFKTLISNFGAIKYKPGLEGEGYAMEPKKGKRSQKGKKGKKAESESAFSKPFDDKTMKKCPHCGANLKKDQDFCLECQNFLG